MSNSRLLWLSCLKLIAFFHPQLCLSLFENNANGLDRRDTADGDLLTERNDICGVFDTIIYVGKCSLLCIHITR